MIDNKRAEWTLPGLHDALIQSLPTLSFDTQILDIGCGTGAWLERLSNEGFIHLHGIDLDTKHFQSLKATCSQANLNFENLNLGNQKYGLITAIEMIEHLENPGRLFYHVSNYLDTKGFFLVTTPNIHSLNCRLKFLITGHLSQFDSKGNQEHIYPVLLSSLYRVLPRYSLKIIKTWVYPLKGSIIYRQSTQLISALLGLIFPNEYSGDILCLLIQKNE